MSYLEYYGLSSEPFSNAPVSRFYYNAPQHQQALTRLLYAVNSMKGLAVLVGEIGAGKTTLARRMLDSLPEEEYEAALLVIIHSGITASWLLRRIALQIGVENPAQEKLALLSQLYQRLLQIYEQGRKAVVLIDEAQMLETRELMEEFRGLLNLEVPERKLISFVFFGLPEIEKNLKLDPPLAQRVAMRYRLEPFTSDSTEAYIKHRLRLAGSARNPFMPDAVEVVHRRAGGTPRVINTICDNALFETFLARATEIRGPLIEQIADNLGLDSGAVATAAASAIAASVSAAPPAPVAVSVAAPPVEVAPPPPPPAVRPAAPTAPPLTSATTAPAPTAAFARPAAPSVPPAVAAFTPPPPSIAVLTMPSMSGPITAPNPVFNVPAQPPPPPAVPPGVVIAPRPPTVQPAVVGQVPAAPKPPPPPADSVTSAEAPTKPRGAVDLAEIDRYLEGLNKL